MTRAPVRTILPFSAPDKAPPTRGKGSIPTCGRLKRGALHLLIASRGLSDRCTVHEGSFFDAVPEGGDAYLLSHVIHDWDEASCLKILTACRRAMKSGSRLLVVEMVIPPGNDFHPGKLSDMIMLAFTPGGCERTATDYAALFAKAGLTLNRVVPTASPVSVVEAVPV